MMHKLWLLVAAGLLSLSGLTSSLRAQDPGMAKFLAAFSKAMEYDDEKTIDRQVRNQPTYALRHFEALAWQQKTSPTEDTAKSLTALRDSWKRVHGTRTLSLLERYISGRTNAERNLLVKLDNAEREIWTLWEQAKKNKQKASFFAAADTAKNLGAKYGELGHSLKASRQWSLRTDILRTLPSPTLDERKLTIEAAEEFLRLRKSWDWTKDALYTGWANWLKGEKATLNDDVGEKKKREEAGYAADAKGADALVMPNAVAEPHTVEFELLKADKPDFFWMGGVAAPLWPSVYIQNKGPAKYELWKRGDLYISRSAPNKYGVTRDGGADVEKAPGAPVVLGAKFKPTKFFMDDEKKQPYAMWFYVAGQQESFLGESMNLAPQADTSRLYCRTACAFKTTIHGEPLTFYDDNCNGLVFEENPYDYAFKKDHASGNLDGIDMPAYDSMKVGKKGTLQPWSQFVKIGDGWFHLAGDTPGIVKSRPLNPEYFKTGSVKLKWSGSKGIQPQSVVIEGTGTFASARYNIVGKKALEVPAGKYHISFGRMLKGKGARAIQAQITKGAMEDIVVTEGETTTVEIGAPFKLDFVRKDEGDKVLVDSSSFVVRGKAGEIYTRVHFVPTTIEVVAAKTESGKGARPVGEFVPMNLDAMNAVGSKKKFGRIPNLVGFFSVPKGVGDSTVLEFKPPFADAKVGLRVKKHKLFGKLGTIFH